MRLRYGRVVGRAGTILGRHEDVGRLPWWLNRLSAGGAAQIEPWSELPMWLPPDHEYAALHAANVERAHAAGLQCRPVYETVADTWAWLSTLKEPAPLRADLPPPGLDRAHERAALAAWHTRAKHKS